MYVQINDFTKTIGGKTVLDSIRVGFEEGTVNGIVGPNGSGKTMLLRALCGFIRPTAGSVSIAGKPVVFNESLPERVGVIIEVPGFIAARTAMENLEYLAGLDGGWDPRETLRLMSLFDLYEHRDEKVKSYSLACVRSSPSCRRSWSTNDWCSSTNRPMDSTGHRSQRFSRKSAGSGRAGPP